MDKIEKKERIVKAIARIIGQFLNAAFALWLWNYFAVHVFTGMPVINYWQACGLYILTNLLFNDRHYYRKLEED